MSIAGLGLVRLNPEHLNAGINQLQAFEQKVRAQVEKSDPALASRLTAMFEAIIGR